MPTVLVKRSAESRVYLFDFSALPEFGNGDTLTGSPTVTATPAGLTLGSVTITNSPPAPLGTGTANSCTQLRVSGGVNGTTYQMVSTASTTLGNTLVCLGVLQVLDR